MKKVQQISIFHTYHSTEFLISHHTIMVDSYRHKGMRKKLVEGIAKKGITDQRILDAIDSIPRHTFLD